MDNKRVLSGLRTTGALHLGHYFGALKNWIEMQERFECFFLLADIQAMTTHFDESTSIEKSVYDVVLDLLSVGIDPNKSTIFLQSQIPELAELTMYFTMITKVKDVEKNPTIKSELKSLRENKNRKDVFLGFLNYPVSQAADILLFSQSPPEGGDELIIPVGKDQVAHIELTKKIARQFNKMFEQNVFVIPEVLVGDVQILKGLDMKDKMSKSLGNAIYLSDSNEEVLEKVTKAYTDPNKVHKDSPGTAEGCAVYEYYKAFAPEILDEVKAACAGGSIGCKDDKLRLYHYICNFLEPIRARRAKYEGDKDLLNDIIREGNKRAREVGKQTLAAAKKAMNIDFPGLGNS